MNGNDAFVSKRTAITDSGIVIEALRYAQIAQVQFSTLGADLVDGQHRQNGVFDGDAVRGVAAQASYRWVNGQRLGSAVGICWLLILSNK